MTKPIVPPLRRKAAADYLANVWGLPAAPATLAKYAVTGDGPAYHLAGRIPLYPIEALDAWARARLGQPRRSTSDKDVPAPAERREPSADRPAAVPPRRPAESPVLNPPRLQDRPTRSGCGR